MLPGGGRLIKSHEPYSGPQKRVYRKAIYLIRDGRDVAVSYYYTLIRRGLYEGDFGPFLRLFLGGGVDGYGPWHQHVESWLASPLRRARLAAGPQVRGPPRRPGREPVGGDGVPRRAGRSRAGGGDDRDLQRREDARAGAASRAFTEQQKRKDIMFVRTAGAGDWAGTFSTEDNELFARVTGDLLRRLGYAVIGALHAIVISTSTRTSPAEPI